MGKIYFEENLKFLKTQKSESFPLIYVDPPFNTGKRRVKTTLKTEQNEKGDRVGFGDRRYVTKKINNKFFEDAFTDYCEYLRPRFQEARRILTKNGSLFVHLDYREVHYAKVLLDVIFGRESFKNEIIWSFDFGARSKKRWPAKHQTILWYAKNPKEYVFNYEAMERIPYMAPGLVGKEKAKRGKTPTDSWWHTVVSTNSAEKTPYPTQKPLGVLRRIVGVHSAPGDVVLDFFCGSGTTGEAAAILDRDFVLVDNNIEACEIAASRLKKFKPKLYGFGKTKKKVSAKNK